MNQGRFQDDLSSAYALSVDMRSDCNNFTKPKLWTNFRLFFLQKYQLIVESIKYMYLEYTVKKAKHRGAQKRKSRLSNKNPEDSAEKTLIKYNSAGKFVDLWWVQLITGIFTIYALFGDDIRLIYYNREHDYIFDILTWIAVILFLLELFLCSIGKPKYFGSFFFWLDTASTISLIFDSPVISNTISAGNKLLSISNGVTDNGTIESIDRAGRAGRAGARAGRIVRFLRIIRLIRVLKILKLFFARKDKVESDDYEGENSLGKELGENTTRKAIVLVLTIFIMTPLFQIEQWISLFPGDAEFQSEVLTDSYDHWICINQYIGDSILGIPFTHARTSKKDIEVDENSRMNYIHFDGRSYTKYDKKSLVEKTILNRNSQPILDNNKKYWDYKSIMDLLKSVKTVRPAEYTLSEHSTCLQPLQIFESYLINNYEGDMLTDINKDYHLLLDIRSSKNRRLIGNLHKSKNIIAYLNSLRSQYEFKLLHMISRYFYLSSERAQSSLIWIHIPSGFLYLKYENVSSYISGGNEILMGVLKRLMNYVQGEYMDEFCCDLGIVDINTTTYHVFGPGIWISEEESGVCPRTLRNSELEVFPLQESFFLDSGGSFFISDLVTKHIRHLSYFNKTGLISIFISIFRNMSLNDYKRQLDMKFNRSLLSIFKTGSKKGKLLFNFEELDKQRTLHKCTDVIKGSDLYLLKDTFVFMFSKKVNTQNAAVLNVWQTIFVCTVLLLVTIALMRDANRLVLEPISRMMNKILRIRDNPMIAATIKEEEYQKELQINEAEKRNTWFKNFQHFFSFGVKESVEEPMETLILDKTLTTIGTLLALGFGEAGSQIVADNLFTSVSGINPMTPGKRVEAIFGYIKINNFTEVTETLQHKVMMFVNQICSVVHSVVDQMYGAPNRNIGNTLLLVWKVSGLEEAEENIAKGIVCPPGVCKLAKHLRKERITDLAVMATILINARINTCPTLAQYRFHPALLQRVSNYRVSLYTGLHLGWSIEGAVGSEFKIDASYLSPIVNIAAFLQNLCKLYGSSVLFSGEVFNHLSAGMKKNFRQIDNIETPGQGQLLSVITCDIDCSSIPILYRRKDLRERVFQAAKRGMKLKELLDNEQLVYKRSHCNLNAPVKTVQKERNESSTVISSSNAKKTASRQVQSYKLSSPSIIIKTDYQRTENNSLYFNAYKKSGVKLLSRTIKLSRYQRTLSESGDKNLNPHSQSGLTDRYTHLRQKSTGNIYNNNYKLKNRFGIQKPQKKDSLKDKNYFASGNSPRTTNMDIDDENKHSTTNNTINKSRYKQSVFPNISFCPKPLKWDNYKRVISNSRFNNKKRKSSLFGNKVCPVVKHNQCYNSLITNSDFQCLFATEPEEYFYETPVGGNNLISNGNTSNMLKNLCNARNLLRKSFLSSAIDFELRLEATARADYTIRSKLDTIYKNLSNEDYDFHDILRLNWRNEVNGHYLSLKSSENLPFTWITTSERIVAKDNILKLINNTRYKTESNSFFAKFKYSTALIKYLRKRVTVDLQKNKYLRHNSAALAIAHHQLADLSVENLFVDPTRKRKKTKSKKAIKANLNINQDNNLNKKQDDISLIFYEVDWIKDGNLALPCTTEPVEDPLISLIPSSVANIISQYPEICETSLPQLRIDQSVLKKIAEYSKLYDKKEIQEVVGQLKSEANKLTHIFALTDNDFPTSECYKIFFESLLDKTKFSNIMENTNSSKSTILPIADTNQYQQKLSLDKDNIRNLGLEFAGEEQYPSELHITEANRGIYETAVGSKLLWLIENPKIHDNTQNFNDVGILKTSDFKDKEEIEHTKLNKKNQISKDYQNRNDYFILQKELINFATKSTLCNQIIEDQDEEGASLFLADTLWNLIKDTYYALPGKEKEYNYLMEKISNIILPITQTSLENKLKSLLALVSYPGVNEDNSNWSVLNSSTKTNLSILSYLDLEKAALKISGKTLQAIKNLSTIADIEVAHYILHMQQVVELLKSIECLRDISKGFDNSTGIDDKSSKEWIKLSPLEDVLEVISRRPDLTIAIKTLRSQLFTKFCKDDENSRITFNNQHNKSLFVPWKALYSGLSDIIDLQTTNEKEENLDTDYNHQYEIYKESSNNKYIISTNNKSNHNNYKISSEDFSNPLEKLSFFRTQFNRLTGNKAMSVDVNKEIIFDNKFMKQRSISEGWIPIKNCEPHNVFMKMPITKKNSINSKSYLTDQTKGSKDRSRRNFLGIISRKSSYCAKSPNRSSISIDLNKSEKYDFVDSENKCYHDSGVNYDNIKTSRNSRLEGNNKSQKFTGLSLTDIEYQESEIVQKKNKKDNSTLSAEFTHEVTMRKIRLHQKLNRLAKKESMWEPNFSVCSLFETDTIVKQMTMPFCNIHFFCLWNAGFLNYESGDWQISKLLLQKTRYLLGQEDIPSKVILEFMESYDYVAPTGWLGRRKLELS